MTPVDQPTGRTAIQRLAGAIEAALDVIRRVAHPSLAQLILRLALAVPFWKSGILKWAGFLRLNDTAIDLFADKFRLHLPGGPYDFPAPAAVAFLSGCGEIVFPVLLVLGLGTRFAATGLLFMTAIVEVTVPEGWPIHITWVAMQLALMAWGPGRIFLTRRFSPTTPRVPRKPPQINGESGPAVRPKARMDSHDAARNRPGRRETERELG